jgi:fatty acid synthase
MDANNLVAPHLEERTGMCTFSSEEMGWLLTALCTPTARKESAQQPLEADLTGGFQRVKALRQTVATIRAELEQTTARIKQRLALQTTETALLGTKTEMPLHVDALPHWPANLRPDAAASSHLASATWPKRGLSLREMVVIVGMGEIGPCGSARTRYEMEIGQDLSPAAVLELAWVTGLIAYEEDGKAGVWKDRQTNEVIAEHEIATRYRDAIRERVGLRWIEPETVNIDPNALSMYSSVFLEKDFTFSVNSEEEARSFFAMAPEQTRVHFDAQDAQWRITRLAGTEIKVPRQVRLPRQVMGQIPKGFDFARFGLSNDMIERVDRVALFNLIATVDAFLSAGIEPEELLRWIHPARVANTQGSGIGGMRSLARLYRDHVLDIERQPDVLQETLINVAAAYVVQSYVGSYGPMSHPVAACATAAVSLEEATDKILAGKADFVVAGGYDDVGRESLVGFGDMNATANTDEMAAMGLEPAQMSRPNDTRRRGFVEAQGGGTFLLARADIAVQMGLPVYGVVGYCGSFGDGIHKSIPAPGMGALACAVGGQQSPLARSLQHFGLTADDIAVVHKHDTSTAANDPNENELHHRIQRALGRSEGNPLFAVSQKSLTGHAKGGAAAWQIIGLCQTLQQGRIAGNPNLDNVDSMMRSFSHIAFSNKTLDVGKSFPLRAGMLTSLGFGHVSGIALILHPDAFLAQLSDEQAANYQARCQQRHHQTTKRWASVLMGQTPLFTRRNLRRFEAQDGTPEQATQEATMLLNPHARLDTASGLYTLPSTL